MKLVFFIWKLYSINMIIGVLDKVLKCALVSRRRCELPTDAVNSVCGFEFDPNAGSNNTIHYPEQVIAECKNPNTSYAADPFKCDVFYQCENRHPTYYMCPPGTSSKIKTFNSKTIQFSLV